MQASEFLDAIWVPFSRMPRVLAHFNRELLGKPPMGPWAAPQPLSQRWFKSERRATHQRQARGQRGAEAGAHHPTALGRRIRRVSRRKVLGS